MLDAWTQRINTSRRSTGLQLQLLQMPYSLITASEHNTFQVEKFPAGSIAFPALMNKLNMDQTRIYQGREFIDSHKTYWFDPELPTVRNMLYPQSG